VVGEVSPGSYSKGCGNVDRIHKNWHYVMLCCVTGTFISTQEMQVVRSLFATKPAPGLNM
jgi:hypothetical protein